MQTSSNNSWLFKNHFLKSRKFFKNLKTKKPTKNKQKTKQTSIVIFKEKWTPYLLFCWSLESKLDCIVEPLRQRDDDEEMSERSLVIT